MAHDCLPTGSQLLQRHVPNAGACFFCSREERTERLFLFCHFARQVWRVVKCNLGFHLCRNGFVHTKQCIFDFIQRATSLEATALVVTIWHIWEARSDVRMHPRRVAEKALAYVDFIVHNYGRTVLASRHDTQYLLLYCFYRRYMQ